MLVEIKKLLEHKRLLGVFVILLLVIIWGVINSKFSFDKYDPTLDMRGTYDVNAVFVKDSILKYRQFPLWTPYVFGGTPFLQYPQNLVFNIPSMLVLLFPFHAAFNLLGMVQLFIIGAAMYFLLLELNLDYKYALVAAFTFMFNRYNQNILTSGGELHFDSLVWLPAVLLFVFRAFKRKDWALNSIFAGVFLALSFHSGDGSVFTYILFFIAILFFYFLATSYKKYKKIILIFALLGVVSFGLAAIRLLPLIDFSKVSDLGRGRSFESAVGYHIESSLPRLVADVIKGFTTEDYKPISDNEIRIGYITFILALLSLPLIKNKNVLFFVISIILLIYAAMGSSLFYVLWKFFPGFDKQHHIIRIIYLVPMCFSVLAGFGSSFLFNNIIGKIKKKWVVNAAFGALFVGLVFGAPYHSPNMKFIRINMDEQMNSNSLMVYLSEEGQKEQFRVHMWGLFNHIGGVGQSKWNPMKISFVHADLNTFEKDYLLQFINPIAASNPAKILGIYNTKYFYSDKNLTNPGLSFAKEFGPCNTSMVPNICDENFGPYLYLNRKYVPRAYIVNNTILVIGKKDVATQAMYAIMVNDKFSPANLAIVTMDTESAAWHNADFFQRFNAIILLENPGDASALAEYSRNGGKLIPNIFKGENSLSEEQVNALLTTYSSSYDNIKKIGIPDYRPNSMKIKLNNNPGFVVIAEKYFMYEGWHTDDKREIMRTNGFSSGVFADANDAELEFSYFPASFKIGMIISLITSLLILAYAIFRFALPQNIKTD